jgi:N-acetylglucosaminyldiphosphoundecaprenol N-acetyl-beta-D-mannosaminyltransferase
MPVCASHHSCYHVLGIPLAPVQIPDLIAQMETWIAERGRRKCVTFANVHVVMEAQRDKEFRSVLDGDHAFIVPDGKPLVWLGRWAGFPLKHRVYGPDVMRDFIALTAGKGYRHFFYGGSPGVPETLRTNFTEKFPGTEVAGVYSPPFRELSQSEDEDVVQLINSARPDVLWVGLGCPKQEKWAFEHRDRLRVPVIAAVGQAFDIHAGRVRQAPRWMRDRGLEWLFRFGCEPRRLWKRYLIYNSQFIWRVLTS